MGGVAGWGGYIGGRAQTDRQTLMTDSDSEVDKIIVTAVKFPHFGNVKRSFPTSYLALSVPSTASSVQRQPRRVSITLLAPDYYDCFIRLPFHPTKFAE